MLAAGIERDELKRLELPDPKLKKLCCGLHAVRSLKSGSQGGSLALPSPFNLLLGILCASGIFFGSS